MDIYLLLIMHLCFFPVIPFSFLLVQNNEESKRRTRGIRSGEPMDFIMKDQQIVIILFIGFFCGKGIILFLSGSQNSTHKTEEVGPPLTKLVNFGVFRHFSAISA